MNPAMNTAPKWGKSSRSSPPAFEHPLRLTHQPKIIQTYDDLINQLKARRKQLGLSQNEFDDLAGLQDGYTGKIENWQHKKSGRGLGWITLPLILQGLGVVLIMATRAKPKKPANSNIKKADRQNDQLELDLQGGHHRQWPKDLNPLARVLPDPPPEIEEECHESDTSEPDGQSTEESAANPAHNEKPARAQSSQCQNSQGREPTAKQ